MVVEEVDVSWPYVGARDVCWFCGGRLCWENDFSLEDVGDDGEGIAIYLHCMGCGAEVEYKVRFDDENNPEGDA